MEKTYNALIERLERAREWHNATVSWFEHQNDLSENEKETLIVYRAITDFLDTVFSVEGKTEV